MIPSRWSTTGLAILALGLLTIPSYAADATETIEARTVRESSGAGLRVGWWDVQGAPTGNGASQTPAFEGYFQKGLDVHLVWENTIGYWGHTYSVTQSGLLGSTQTTFHTHLVPSLTALKLYPFTTRADTFEPFAIGGLGLALGIAQQQTSGGTPGANDGTTFVTGLGIRAGGGFDWHWTPVFGMTAGVRYEWATFGQKAGPQAMYRGPGMDAGLTYRFQYR